MHRKETTTPITYLDHKIQLKELNGLNTEKEKREISDLIADAYTWASEILKNRSINETIYKKEITSLVKKAVYGSEEIPPFAYKRVEMVYSHLPGFFNDFIQKYNQLKFAECHDNMAVLQASFDILREFFTLYKEAIENITAGEPMDIEELYVPMAEYLIEGPDSRNFFEDMDLKIKPIDSIIVNAIKAHQYNMLHEQLRCMLSLSQLMDDFFFLLDTYMTT